MSGQGSRKIAVTLSCPQDNKDCVGEKSCNKDKKKGCAIETLKIWQIEAEDRWDVL